MILNWFAPKAVRTAREMCKHVRRILNAQRDILSPQAIEGLEAALGGLKAAIAGRAKGDALEKQTKALETAANKWLKPYPNAVLRENVEVLLVALAVALGIRTFFVQPFKIPTGSMQPTLFGVTQGSLPQNGNFVMPGRVARFFDYWINGNSYFDIRAPEDGVLQAVSRPTRILLFNLVQQYQFNGRWHKVWFPPDDLFQRAGCNVSSGGQVFGAQHLRAGEPVLQLRVTAGDHLFVDRLSYNFRRPQRGDIVVFETKGIPKDMRHREGFESWDIPDDQFYIKRLVVLGGETVQIGDDRHLVIDGVRLDKNTPHFEKVYGFDPEENAHESRYSGHLNAHLGHAPLFPNEAAKQYVQPGHYMVMGDNTVSSLDSRYWGEFPETAVVGKYFFVYWPFSDRFGMNVR